MLAGWYCAISPMLLPHLLHCSLKPTARSPFPYSTSAALLFPDSTLLLNGPSAYCAALPFPERITRELECLDCSLDPHLPLSHLFLNVYHQL